MIHIRNTWLILWLIIIWDVGSLTNWLVGLIEVTWHVVCNVAFLHIGLADMWTSKAVTHVYVRSDSITLTLNINDILVDIHTFCPFNVKEKFLGMTSYLSTRTSLDMHLDFFPIFAVYFQGYIQKIWVKIS